jgi:YidC/Oxa1 family membrane protein insertase
MERSGLARWLLLGLAVFLLITFLPKLFGKDDGEAKLQPLQYEGSSLPETRQPEQLCDLPGDGYLAQLTTQGATLKHFFLKGSKYERDGKEMDLSTTPDIELRRQLRFQWRNEALEHEKGKTTPPWQIDYDSVDWKLVGADGKRCEFSYQDDSVEITKIIRASDRPYLLELEARLENRAKAPRKHALSVHTTAWRTSKEVEGHMFRVSPFITHVECVDKTGEDTRLNPGDFDPDDFKEPQFKSPLATGDWYTAKGAPDFASVSNAYFAHAIAPEAHPVNADPVCQLQIENRWDTTRYRSQSADPNGGAMYRARLAYPAQVLAPGATARYKLVSYIGPKERDKLAAAGAGKHDLRELIDLGFFAEIAKVLVAFLLFVYGIIPNWGIAIIILTIVARTLLFPLSWPSIKSMIKMRELKPELDVLTAKYKDDAQARGLAQMELWRKHNVNPLKGCLPQLASMPVWFALYTTLQTAVELYNIPFLWFPDLSQPDPLYILPFVIGGTSFLQQKLLPMQGDPAQQKMMLYMMPAMFTVFMLFLPAGLGVYMFTNGVLGIGQQQIVEWHVRRTTKRDRAGQATEAAKTVSTKAGGKKSDEESSDEPRGKKGKTGGPGSKAEFAEGRPLLGKGKA